MDPAAKRIAGRGGLALGALYSVVYSKTKIIPDGPATLTKFDSLHPLHPVYRTPPNKPAKPSKNKALRPFPCLMLPEQAAGYSPLLV